MNIIEHDVAILCASLRSVISAVLSSQRKCSLFLCCQCSLAICVFGLWLRWFVDFSLALFVVVLKLFVFVGAEATCLSVGGSGYSWLSVFVFSFIVAMEHKHGNGLFETKIYLSIYRLLIFVSSVGFEPSSHSAKVHERGGSI